MTRLSSLQKITQKCSLEYFREIQPLPLSLQVVKEYLLLATLAFSSAHKLFSKEKEIGFLFNDLVLKIDTWVWFLFEHVNMIIYVVVMMIPGEIRRLSIVVFLLIHVVDLVSFLLIYDDIFKGLPLTWNVVKGFIFLMVINVNQEWKR